MPADFRFHSGSPYASKYSTSASSASSSSLLSSRRKLPLVIHNASSRSKDPTVRLKYQSSMHHDAGLELLTVDSYVALICSSYRDAEVIVFERMAKSARLGLPTDIAALKLGLCLYRGRTGIQIYYDETYMEYGSVFADGDGGIYLE